MIVAWRSPITGGGEHEGCIWLEKLLQWQTSVQWSLDKGSTTLKSGTLWPGRSAAATSRCRVSLVHKGEVLYFIVDSANFEDCYCATPVDLRVSITQVR